MRYAVIRPLDVSNGEGVGVSLFIQGCSIHCKGCFQPETWDFEGGKLYTQEIQNKILELLKPSYIQRFSILGGEPLENCNLFKLANLINAVKKMRPDIKIWLYTGYTVDQLREKLDDLGYLKYILTHINVLVAGPFIEEEKDLSLKWCGSRNQTVIGLSEGH